MAARNAVRATVVMLAAVTAAAFAGPGAPVHAEPARPVVASTTAADGDNRAVVVVDTGDGRPKSACVLFRTSSINGIDLLRAARMDPEVQGYSGQGGAVCKLCGVGCERGGSCLTCQAPTYWQYWRAAAGATAFTYASSGAGSTQVRDGDVDGWTWAADKRPPPFVSVDSVCADPQRTYRFEPASEPSPTTTSTAPQNGSSSGSPASSSGSSTTSPPPAGSPPRSAPRATPPPDAPSGATPAPSVAPPDTGAPVADSAGEAQAHGSEGTNGTNGDGLAAGGNGGSASDHGEVAAGARATPAANGRRSGGTSPAAVGALLAALAALGAWTWRHRRRTPA